MICSQCGREVRNESAIYCPYCANPLRLMPPTPVYPGVTSRPKTQVERKEKVDYYVKRVRDNVSPLVHIDMKTRMLNLNELGREATRDDSARHELAKIANSYSLDPKLKKRARELLEAMG